MRREKGLEKSQAELLTEISLKLDSILAFLVARANQEDQGAVVKRLYENGLSAEVIGRITGISENAVNIRLTRLRKKSAQSSGKARTKDKVGTGDKSTAEESSAV